MLGLPGVFGGFFFSCWCSGRAGLWRGLVVWPGADPVPESRVPLAAESAAVRGAVEVIPGVLFGELLCGIGGSQKRAAFGVGCEGDTSPRNGSCAATCGCCA